MPDKADLFEQEKAEIKKFLANRSIAVDDSVKAIFKTLYQFLEKYPAAVKDIDLAALSETMAKKAEQFYGQFKDDLEGTGITLEKDRVYLYSYSSITVKYGEKAATILYPYVLVTLANFRNFILLLCRKLQKSSRKITLEDFITVYLELNKRCKPKIDKWDVNLLLKLSQHDFSSRYPQKGIYKYRNNSRFQRLGYLGILALYANVNFPALDLIPYMHLSSKHGKIPDSLSPFIELEYHPAKKEKDYKVFRAFLLPVEREGELSSILAEIGITGRVQEWYFLYNWEDFYQTRKGTWKWKLDFNKKERESSNSHRFDLIDVMDPCPVSKEMMVYLNAVHELQSINESDIAAFTEISENMTRKYRQQAEKNRLVIYYWVFSHLGVDNYYQICLENKRKNQQLMDFLSSLPKVNVMKSKEFCRFIVYLPSIGTRKLNQYLIEGGERGEFEILWRRNVMIDEQMILYGVDLKQVKQFKTI